MALEPTLRQPTGHAGAGVIITSDKKGADTWEQGAHAPAIGPWKLAFRRLRRNKVAMLFLGVFIAIVVVCLLAPVYAKHVAHIAPNANNITGTVGGKNIVSPDGVPIGPTWQSHYFFGADTNGRDLAVRLLYGGRTSLEIGGMATAIIIIFGTLFGLLAGHFRG